MTRTIAERVGASAGLGFVGRRAPNPVVSALVIALAAAGTTACGDPLLATSPPNSAATLVPSSSAVTLVPGELSSPVRVPARANIFGAGHDVPPDPGGGGPGLLPPVVYLPPGAGRVLTFPSVTGKVNPYTGVVGVPDADFVGPAGDGGRFGTTDVQSFGGISGVVHRSNGMFLVGVLLDDAAPQVAPERLDFTDRKPSDASLPEIGQTFLIGDGQGLVVRVPDGATRLFLGFVDGFNYQGLPGFYNNNEGHLLVTVQPW
jgi:hypothetical protein